MNSPALRSYRPQGDEAELLEREWLVTNGRGGYASGTVGGANTRRYHGLLTAAHAAPIGRVLMLKQLLEELEFDDGSKVQIGGEEHGLEDYDLPTALYLDEFRLEWGLPCWVFRIGEFTLERRIVLPHLQNTVYIWYRLLQGPGSLRMRLQPFMHFRSHEDSRFYPFIKPYKLSVIENCFEISSNEDLPVLRMKAGGENSYFVIDRGERREIFFRKEAERGYDPRGVLWSPGFYTIDLAPGREACLAASTEDWNTVQALSTAEAFCFEQQRRQRLLDMADPKVQENMAAELIQAADQFLIIPAGRVRDHAWAHAAGDQIRTVIAGYHWFTDWGRDTMISLEGLTLTTGRFAEASWILRTFGHYVRDGLLPNMFPEGTDEGLYHTADATLWFFHAMQRYLDYTEDDAMLQLLLPVFKEIVKHHIEGTHFGIKVDPDDGLLSQGADGYQLTWMDAKVDDWVVTPRRGKAVEINALWYNALCLTAQWIDAEEGSSAAEEYRQLADRVSNSFNQRFWYEEGNYLFDVIDGEHGNETALRPNQVFAISLDYPVLDARRWEPVLNCVHENLLTPVGLRSLAPSEPDYKSRYYGDLRARDAAYHQGTVWGWLIGPFIDAWLRWKPDDLATARSFLKGFDKHLDEACMGSISEIFDAEPPFTARGCVAQAWSVAEVLRCWAKTSAIAKEK